MEEVARGEDFVQAGVGVVMAASLKSSLTAQELEMGAESVTFGEEEWHTPIDPCKS